MNEAQFLIESFSELEMALVASSQLSAHPDGFEQTALLAASSAVAVWLAIRRSRVAREAQ